ncbi:MAG: T9SS type A sorting domain-containing protein [Flavobacteriaceae bacterium]
MKKIYILAIALVAFAFTGTSQIIDDTFEFYNLGEMGAQGPGVWTSWSNDGGATGAEGIYVTDAFGNPGQAGECTTAGQDPVLLFGNQTSGDFSLVWDMYIPSGKSGYLNMQGEIPAEGTALSGVWNSGDIYFNEGDGAPGQMEDKGNTGVFMAFPHDSWFKFSIYFDLDAGTPTYTISVDGVAGATLDFATDTTLGGMNLFVTGPMEMYVDNIIFQNGPLLGATDFDANNFNVAMSNGLLTIKANDNIDSVEIYNMLGQQVYNGTIGTSRTTINMSSFANGTYIVRASVNGTLSTVKVIK